tara:strand:- start:1051 stop:2274 length:1224 start_codon:yes stop_codon:yes gene_type:complete
MDHSILKTLLSHQFFTENLPRLHENLFESDSKEVFRTITAGHESYGRDLSLNDIKALWTNSHPVATEAQRGNLLRFIDQIESAHTLSEDISGDVIYGLWQRQAGTHIADLGLQISEGKTEAFEALAEKVDSYRKGFTPSQNYEFTTSDTEELLKTASNSSRWKFNIPPLFNKVYGIGSGEFASVFAVPNAGKTAFMITLCFAPGGFADQGAKVLYVVNEEKSQTTKLRSQMCRSGMAVQDVELDPLKVKKAWQDIDERSFFLDIHEWSLSQLDELTRFVEPDIIVVDQADKLNIKGSFGASHERLRELYRCLREYAKRNSAAVFAMSQASNEARGKSSITPFEMEGSKIGKSAELDLIIGIGATEPDFVQDQEPDYTRYLTIGKNKLNGWHGQIVCFLEAGISRYVV